MFFIYLITPLRKFFFFFSSRRRHTRLQGDWSSDVCSSDLHTVVAGCLPGYGRKSEWLDTMRRDGFRVHAAEGDVAEFDSCAEMFYQVRAIVGPIDILVNNAGITRDSVF